MKTRLFSFILFATTTACLSAKDWTRFRGDNGQGISTEKVPLAWSGEKNLKWRLELPGTGSSSAVAAGGKVFVTCYSGVGEGAADLTELVRHLVCADRKSGKILWERKVANKQTDITGNISPSPVIGGGTVYVFGGYPRTARTAVRIDGAKGEIPAARALWDERDASYVPTPVLIDGYLYWASDSGYACCAEAESGDIVFKERLDAQGRSSRGKPFYAAAVATGDGKIITVSRWGGSFVFEAKPEFKLLAHNKIGGDASHFHGTPAISDGQIFLRSEKFLYCIGE